VTTLLAYVLIIGLGSYKLTEWYKEGTKRMGLQQPGWWKSLINLICCGVLVLLATHRSVDSRVLIAIAASGVAALLHAVDTVLRSHRDEMVMQVLEKRSRRR